MSTQKVLMAQVFLMQGSNQGDKAAHLKLSLHYIADRLGEVGFLSDAHESEPWGMGKECPVFWNQLVLLNTHLSPITLLRNILEIEHSCGRKHKSINGNYQNRTIDIDILFYDQMIFQSPDLIIPHPLLHLRRFVLEPLYESFPEEMHPIFRKNMHALLLDCSDNLRVRKIK
ncbi:2-amino-4-hydroxy-6-hydroxymethyldihydropteridine diphosphokinase [Bacteroidetes bacterium endosymbiont of Geopemphigus sp.]|uniref:2-amino-4-hydroxy-6- hydroxymethyldihydropteridine diphosphokinase n=1 Tax=Bacteroidetes bacterium endosymbiont of Geopemphigus sp. TaxID=2047937 RepID=UPI000CD096B2|nr:2-amino-4-hydroxy-6-hydroxymethyldihydropteridine diphosphokinase [Bacteroidetes bacterium endosymbiont of Geopemphigus sp.]